MVAIWLMVISVVLLLGIDALFKQLEKISDSLDETLKVLREEKKSGWY